MTTLIIQPADDALRANLLAPDTNYGTDVQMIVGERIGFVDAVNHSWVRFLNLSDGTIPSSASVSSAVLEIYITDDFCANARTHRVFRAKRAWTEAGLTWNKYDGASNWQTAGGIGANDKDAAECGNVALGVSDSGWVSFDLDIAKVQQMISGAWTDEGFVFITDTELDDAYGYATNDHGTAAWKPKLTVVYFAISGAKSVNEILSEDIKSINEINLADIKALQGLS